MPQPEFEREHYAQLKEAIDLLAEGGLFGYDALGQLLASYPLPSWPPTLFPSALALLRERGIDHRYPPPPPPGWTYVAPFMRGGKQADVAAPGAYPPCAPGAFSRSCWACRRTPSSRLV